MYACARVFVDIITEPTHNCLYAYVFSFIDTHSQTRIHSPSPLPPPFCCFRLSGLMDDFDDEVADLVGSEDPPPGHTSAPGGGGPPEGLLRRRKLSQAIAEAGRVGKKAKVRDQMRGVFMDDGRGLMLGERGLCRVGGGSYQIRGVWGGERVFMKDGRVFMCSESGLISDERD